MHKAPGFRRVAEVLEIIEAFGEFIEANTRKRVDIAGIAAEGDKLGVSGDSGGDVEEELWLVILSKPNRSACVYNFGFGGSVTRESTVPHIQLDVYTSCLGFSPIPPCT